MLFAAYKNGEVWGLIPQDGPFAGRVVVEVEAFSMDNVKVEARTLVGTLKSIWGMVVKIDDALGDALTARYLRIGRSFDLRIGGSYYMDYDGLRIGGRRVKALRRATVFGGKIFGQET